MRYIGGKSLLLENINIVIETYIPDVNSVIDLFSGSSVVSSNFKIKGYQTISNDYLYFSYVLTRAAIMLNRKPEFKKLGIGSPIDYLNVLTIDDMNAVISFLLLTGDTLATASFTRLSVELLNVIFPCWSSVLSFWIMLFIRFSISLTSAIEFALSNSLIPVDRHVPIIEVNLYCVVCSAPFLPKRLIGVVAAAPPPAPL